MGPSRPDPPLQLGPLAQQSERGPARLHLEAKGHQGLHSLREKVQQAPAEELHPNLQRIIRDRRRDPQRQKPKQHPAQQRQLHVRGTVPGHRWKLLHCAASAAAHFLFGGFF